MNNIKETKMIDEILRLVKGEFAAEGEAKEVAIQAYDMGVEYGKTGKFNNSIHYRNYKYQLEDGSTVAASSFYRVFTTRTQTPAYIRSEEILLKFFNDDNQEIFHMMRNQRFGINGVFRAVMSSREAQQLNLPDYILVITCFVAGLMTFKSENGY